MNSNITFRANLQYEYSDVLTPEVLEALSVLVSFNDDIKAVMARRLARRAERQKKKTADWFP